MGAGMVCCEQGAPPEAGCRRPRLCFGSTGGRELLLQAVECKVQGTYPPNACSFSVHRVGAEDITSTPKVGDRSCLCLLLKFKRYRSMLCQHVHSAKYDRLEPVLRQGGVCT